MQWWDTNGRILGKRHQEYETIRHQVNERHLKVAMIFPKKNDLWSMGQCSDHDYNPSNINLSTRLQNFMFECFSGISPGLCDFTLSTLRASNSDIPEGVERKSFTCPCTKRGLEDRNRQNRRQMAQRIPSMHSFALLPFVSLCLSWDSRTPQKNRKTTWEHKSNALTQ